MQGRHSEFTQEIADEVCEAVATSSRGLEHICSVNEDFPSARTIWRWLADPDREDFRQQYARAKERQAEFMGDEILVISDDGSNDTYIVGDGDEAREVVNHDHIARSKLRVDSRKWLMSKLLPKKYGDKLELGGNLTISHEEALEQLK